MKIYTPKPLELDGVKTYPLGGRASMVSVKDFARVASAGASLAEWLRALPHILAANDFRAVVAALERHLLSR